jgi:hypothetical protein
LEQLFPQISILGEQQLDFSFQGRQRRLLGVNLHRGLVADVLGARSVAQRAQRLLDVRGCSLGGRRVGTARNSQRQRWELQQRCSGAH